MRFLAFLIVLTLLFYPRDIAENNGHYAYDFRSDPVIFSRPNLVCSTAAHTRSSQKAPPSRGSRATGDGRGGGARQTVRP